MGAYRAQDGAHQEAMGEQGLSDEIVVELQRHISCMRLHSRRIMLVPGQHRW